MTRDCLIVMRKEIDEMMKSRYILASMATFPLLFSVVIPLLYLVTLPANVSASDVSALSNLVQGFASMTPRQAMISFLVQSNLPFYLLMPGILPTLIAAYSIAGEKKNGTLEPLLATPVQTADILLGKTLAAVLPAVLITWLSFAVYAVMINRFTGGLIVLPDALWAIVLLLTGPLIAVFSVFVAVLVSARLSDVRAAQQVSAVIIVPIMALFVLQLMGMVTLRVDAVLLVSAGLLLVDVALVKAGTVLFQREEILTRWG